MLQLSVDKTLNALADPTRRAIIEQLNGGEQRVSDIAEPHQMSLNAVSKHIKVLEDAGLLSRRREGRTHYLSFDPGGLDPATEWIERTKALWSKRFDALEEALLADDANQNGREDDD
ncbi:MAG: metalloregulator ArsR/SmtB family transcription factor [Pseudomonadota bacterium]